MLKDYMLELEELREFLSWFLRKDLLEELVALQELLNSSFVHRYKEIVDGTIQGVDCGYAHSAKELFMKLHEKPISDKIKYIYENFLKGK